MAESLESYKSYIGKTKTTRETTRLRNRRSNESRIDRPKNLGIPRMAWGSDVVAEVTRRLDLKYIALAQQLGFPLITSDEVMVKKLINHSIVCHSVQRNGAFSWVSRLMNLKKEIRDIESRLGITFPAP